MQENRSIFETHKEDKVFLSSVFQTCCIYMCCNLEVHGMEGCVHPIECPIFFSNKTQQDVRFSTRTVADLIIHAHTHIHTHTHIHVYIGVYICVCIYIYTYVHCCINIYVPYLCPHEYKNTYTLTHTCKKKALHIHSQKDRKENNLRACQQGDAVREICICTHM